MPVSVGERVVLMTGATGMVGPSVVKRFASAGFRVRVLARHAPEGRRFGTEIELLTGDVADPFAARRATDGADTIVHMAALLHASDGAGLDREAYRRTNVQGTAEMMQAGLRANVRRFVLFSTIAVYGAGRGEVWAEDSPIRPETLYALTKVEAERIVLEAKRPDGTPLGVVLRLGAVFGPNLKGNYLRLVQALASRRFVPVGPGANRRAIINSEDAAEAAFLAATHPGAAGRVYNVSDGEQYSLSDIIAAICRALNRRPPRLRLPLAPVRGTIAAVEAVARHFSARPPVSLAAVEKYTEDVRVSTRRIRDDLGFVPGRRLDEGWVEAIRAMRESGEL